MTCNPPNEPLTVGALYAMTCSVTGVISPYSWRSFKSPPGSYAERIDRQLHNNQWNAYNYAVFHLFSHVDGRSADHGWGLLGRRRPPWTQ